MPWCDWSQGFKAEFRYQAFDALSTAFRFQLYPTGPIERANRLEAGLAADGIDPLLSGAQEKTLNRIATYRMRAERTLLSTNLTTHAQLNLASFQALIKTE